MPYNKQALIAKGMRLRLDKNEPLIIVDAYVNNKGPFNLVVDTGASMTIISPAVARAAGVNQEGARAKATGATGNLDARVARLKSLKLGSNELNGINVAIMSLATLNRATRLRLGGIIGYNVLKRFQITIDYSIRRILFTPVDKRKTRT
ncbi:MAG TPA: retropepsin-like aspartic protease [Blastocatellia bacterium]|nr:retropepsin-like aspartic protease [Blastocatellia bacterium]